MHLSAQAANRAALELGFRRVDFGRRRYYLAPAIAEHAHEIEQYLTPIDPPPRSALGNRRSALAMTMQGLPPMFVRRYRRGGLMRFVLSDLYAGLEPRPLNELIVTAGAHRRGLPVVEPLGATVEWLGPWFYRGWLMTRALDGVTLWDLLLGGGEPEVRRQALEQARASIVRSHDGGLYHADLNFHNLFVCTGAQPPQVVLLDLDKARLYLAGLPPSLRRANLLRLRRSARRLIYAGSTLEREELAVLGIGPG